VITDAGLVAARFFHFACAIVLFGASLSPLYLCLRADNAQRLGRWLRPILIAAAVGGILSGLAWFGFTAANMSGALADALDGETLVSVLSDTDFGHVWAARMPLMILFLLAAIWFPGTSPLGIVLLAFLAAVLLGSLAGVGHTQLDEEISTGIRGLADAIHLLASGAWLGGLLPLSLILASGRKAYISNDDAVIALSRFSGMAYAAVAALLATGLINSWYLVGSFARLVDTTYGHVLALKLGLFGLMLLLAVTNRFWLVPAIARSTNSTASEGLLIKLRRQIIGEQVLGFAVVAIVSVLGTLAPAIQGS
jgi:copper resistance protein D